MWRNKRKFDAQKISE